MKKNDKILQNSIKIPFIKLSNCWGEMEFGLYFSDIKLIIIVSYKERQSSKNVLKVILFFKGHKKT